MLSRLRALQSGSRQLRERNPARTPKFGSLLLQGIVAVAVAIGGAVGLYLLLAWLLGVSPHPTGSGSGQPVLPLAEQQKLLADLIKVALGLAAGIGAAFALVVSFRRARAEEAASHRDDHRLFSSRYQDAADLIGSDKAAVRLAGIYAMARLADDWTEQRQQCIDVLCAYLRLPYDPDPETGDLGEREVRYSAIALIRDHLLVGSRPSWTGHDFDFNGAVFDGGDFHGARFVGGTVNFYAAQFTGGTIDFHDAQFAGGAVVFRAAQFIGGTVNFRETHLAAGTVDFHAAHFIGGTVNFRDAHLAAGTVDFSGAEFVSGTIHFGGVRFTGGTVDFRDAELAGGTVNFRDAQFAGGTADFRDAAFTRGIVRFDGAHFSGSTVHVMGGECSVHFGGAIFAGGTVRFRGAEFTGGAVDFDGAQFDGGAVDFNGARLIGGSIGFRGAEFIGGTMDLTSTVPGPDTTTDFVFDPAPSSQYSPRLPAFLVSQL